MADSTTTAHQHEQSHGQQRGHSYMRTAPAASDVTPNWGVPFAARPPQRAHLTWPIQPLIHRPQVILLHTPSGMRPVPGPLDGDNLRVLDHEFLDRNTDNSFFFPQMKYLFAVNIRLTPPQQHDGFLRPCINCCRCPSPPTVFSFDSPV